MEFNKTTNDNQLSSGGFRYISPTTDFGFKKLFGDSRIMKGFLNALFSSKERGILSLRTWSTLTKRIWELTKRIAE